MAYKKYIKRNGKVYGPYIYHSKRVDGKVVSEYRGGLKKPRKYINFLLLFGVMVIIGLLIFLLVSSERVFSGQATLGLDAKYKEGEALQGKLDLSLKEGEFIPANSKIIFENNGNIKEFELKEIVSAEISEGEFYVEGKNIQGTGEGYGSRGSSKNYEEVHFELNIYTEETSVEEEFPQEEEPEEEINESEEIVEEPEVEEETAPVTGNFFVRLGSFFLGLTPTGQIALELEKTIQGKISFGEEFIYELGPGESVELKPLSVKTSSGEELEDKDIKLKVQDNKVIITTNYVEKEKGYGEEFLGDDLFKVSIDLQDLNLEVVEGDLSIKLVYGNSELLNLESSLQEGQVISEEPPEELVEEEPEVEINETEINETEINETIDLNETIDFNQTNKTNYTISIIDIEPLSIQEKARLLGYFGDAPIEIVKSELFKDRLVVGYKIGEYEIEFSYDSNISPEILEKVMENDRIIWLRDLSKSLGAKESSGQEVDLSNFTNDSLTLKDI